MDPQGSFPEKRRHPRILDHYVVYVTRPYNVLPDTGQASIGIVHDISLSGLSFLTIDPYPEHQLLDIELRIPDKEGTANRAISIQAKTVRIDKLAGMSLVAVAFLDMDEEELILLRSALSH